MSKLRRAVYTRVVVGWDRRGRGAAACATIGWLVVAACNSSRPAPRTWVCPEGWTTFLAGGCGPEVLLCVDGGGAADGACNSVDLTQRRTHGGDAGVAIYRAADGGLVGGWAEPGDPTGPPARGSAPDAGWTACPPGWSQIDGRCDPRLRADCPAGSAALPGGRCTRTSDVDCPTTDFADPGSAPGSSRVVYVRASADPVGADGTETRPFTSITAGIGRAGADGWVLVAAGTYPESLDIAQTIHLIGVCSTRVVLAPAGTAPRVRAAGTAADLDLRGVTLRGPGEGVHVDPGAHVRLERLRIEGAVGRGIRLVGPASTVLLSDVVIAGTRELPDGSRGRGLQVEAEAMLRAEGMAILDSRAQGVVAFNAGTTVTLRDCTISATMPARAEPSGDGLLAQTGSRVIAERIVIEGNHGSGAAAIAAGSSVQLRDTVVRAARSFVAPTGVTGGVGLTMTAGGTVSAERFDISDCDEIGVFATGDTAVGLLTDGSIRDIRAGSAGFGRGASVERGASLTVRGVRVDGAFESGMGVGNAGSRLVVTDSIVSHVRAAGAASWAAGIHVAEGGRAELAHVAVVDNERFGATADGVGSVLRIVDSWVERNGARSAALSRFGVAGSAGSDISLERVRVADNFGSGVFIGGKNARLTIVRSAVEHTHALDNGSDGAGIAVRSGARADVTACSIEDSVQVGVYANGSGSSLLLRESVIRRVAQMPGGVMGLGLMSYRAGTIEMTDCLVESAYELGVSVESPDATFAMRDVIVRDVQSGTRGLGMGIAFWGTNGTLDRVAVDFIRGFGVAAGPSGERTSSPVGAAVVASNVFVRAVRSTTVAVAADRRSSSGLPVASGLLSGRLSSFVATRVVLADGGYGFYLDGGRLTLNDAVIARQLDALGVARESPAAGALVLESVASVDNAREDWVLRPDLPQSAALEPPTGVCVAPPCP